ncbi:PAAR domain-containing protein [Moraxella lacunata]|uniref:PAAR domain-containing protein n=1 Tax=Moraxella lacunata TaxID=477 RepID=UPI0024A7447B|nr:PAAR domain-containing protein [Moraxella lacunata]
MPLTRYYILESDTTTAGGIVQTTTNPTIFNVSGKKQSCIGDDVWCPACQSMGKIVPTGPRLSFSLGGAMPALNDDLCLCKCNPPPKLIHSQTSFKEIIDDNRLAQYRQAQAQYRQAKLQNNLTSTKTNDELPNFTAHFRRPDDYQGGYGFDWLRDEYLYGTDKSKKVYFGAIEDLTEEYRSYQRKELVNLSEIIQYGRPNEYTPAWLNLFSPSNQSKTGLSSVDLHLYFEQSDQDTPLTDDETLLIFRCSDGLMVDTPTLTMSDVLSNMTKESVNLIMEQSAYQQKKNRVYIRGCADICNQDHYLLQEQLPHDYCYLYQCFKPTWHHRSVCQKEWNRKTSRTAVCIPKCKKKKSHDTTH